MRNSERIAKCQLFRAFFVLRYGVHGRALTRSCGLRGLQNKARPAATSAFLPQAVNHRILAQSYPSLVRRDRTRRTLTWGHIYRQYFLTAARTKPVHMAGVTWESIAAALQNGQSLN